MLQYTIFVWDWTLNLGVRLDWFHISLGHKKTPKKYSEKSIYVFIGGLLMIWLGGGIGVFTNDYVVSVYSGSATCYVTQRVY